MNIKKPKNVGKYTYGHENIDIIFFGIDDYDVNIGMYCSIGPNCKILVGGGHRTDWITTYPFPLLSQWSHLFGYEKDLNFMKSAQPSKGDVHIGNDVWIGMNVTIMSGVKIHDGAVITANSHVIKDVEPYEIVGGNPSYHLKYRFNEKIRQSLVNNIRWWEWNDEKVTYYLRYLCDETKVEEFVDIFSNMTLSQIDTLTKKDMVYYCQQFENKSYAYLRNLIDLTEEILHKDIGNIFIDNISNHFVELAIICLTMIKNNSYKTIYLITEDYDIQVELNHILKKLGFNSKYINANNEYKYEIEYALSVTNNVCDEFCNNIKSNELILTTTNTTNTLNSCEFYNNYKFKYLDTNKDSIDNILLYSKHFQKNKYLVYYVVDNNDKYIDQLMYSLYTLVSTMQYNSSIDLTIGIITNSEGSKKISENNIYNYKLKFWLYDKYEKFKTWSGLKVSMLKTYIYEIIDDEFLDQINTILYVDTDIIFRKDLNHIFSYEICNDLIYVVPEVLHFVNILDTGHCLQKINYETKMIEPNISQEDVYVCKRNSNYIFNAGQFLWKNTKFTKQLFVKLTNLEDEYFQNNISLTIDGVTYKANESGPLFFVEQSFMNTILNKDNVVDNVFLRKFASFKPYNKNDFTIVSDSTIFIHCLVPTNEKNQFMKEMYTKYLNTNDV